MQESRIPCWLRGQTRRAAHGDGRGTPAAVAECAGKVSSGWRVCRGQPGGACCVAPRRMHLGPAAGDRELRAGVRRAESARFGALQLAGSVLVRGGGHHRRAGGGTSSSASLHSTPSEAKKGGPASVTSCTLSNLTGDLHPANTKLTHPHVSLEGVSQNDKKAPTYQPISFLRGYS